MKPISHIHQFLVKGIAFSLCLVTILFIDSYNEACAQTFPDFQVDLVGSLIPDDPTAGLSNRDAIQAAIDEVHAHGGGVVKIPPSTFYVEPLIQGQLLSMISLRSFVHIAMAADTVLQLLPDSSLRPYGLFEVRQNEPSGETLQNVKISGGHLVGPDNAISLGSTSTLETNADAQAREYGIVIMGDVKDVVLHGIKISDFTLDGILISHRAQDGVAPTSVRVRHIQSHDNKRNGMGIVGGDHILVRGGQYTRNQLAGIDVENESGKPIHQVKIVNVNMSSNVSADPNLAGHGLILQKGLCSNCSGDINLAINDVEVKNCRIEHNSGGGISIGGSQPSSDPTNLPFQHLQILRNVIRHNQGPFAGISVRNASGLRVHRNQIHGNGLQGISTLDVSRLKISRNSIINNGDDGIVVGGSSPPVLKCIEGDFCRIAKNIVTDHDTGIAVLVGKVAIFHNWIDASERNGIAVGWSQNSGTEGSRISDNTISDSTFHGITVGAPNAKVENNDVLRSGLFGIHVEPSATNATVRQNTVGLSQRTGIHVSAPGTYLRSNLIQDSGLEGMFDGILFNHLDTVAQLGGNSVFHSSAVGIHILSAAAGIDEMTIAALNTIQGSGVQDVLIGP